MIFILKKKNYIMIFKKTKCMQKLPKMKRAAIQPPVLERLAMGLPWMLTGVVPPV